MNIQALIQIGGNEWRSGDKHRIYFNFNDLPDLLGLTVERYRSGSVSSACLDGKPLANSRATEILGMLRVAKFYYDVGSGEFRWNMGDTRTLSGAEMASRIKRAILERVQQEGVSA